MSAVRFLLGIVVVLAVVFPAHALYFEDVQGFDTQFGPFSLDAAYVRGDFDYVHDLSGVSDGYRWDSASLELEITGDFTDFQGKFLWFDWDFTETVDASFPGLISSASVVPSISFGEVDNGRFQIPLETDWLEGFENLAVHLDVYNASGAADIFLLSSRLSGELTEINSNPNDPPNSVPVPGGIVLLSSGVLVLATLRKKND